MATCKTSAKKPARDWHGHLLPGNTANPNGRPRKNEPLQDALKAYEAKHDVSFLETYFRAALNDKATMRDLAGRLYPTLKAVDGSMVLSGQVDHIIVNFADIDLDEIDRPE